MTRWNRLIITTWAVILVVMLALGITSAFVALGCRSIAGHQGLTIDAVNGQLRLEWFSRNPSDPPEYLAEPWTQPKDRFLIIRYMLAGPRPGLDREKIGLHPFGKLSWGRAHFARDFARLDTPVWFLAFLHTVIFALLYLLALRHFQQKGTPSRS